jgi:multidrug resistance efflux pump
MPKQAKGRWLIGLLVLGFTCAATYAVWDQFFRYQAYGTVTGQTIQISSPWDGNVACLNVRAGDVVQQNQLLANLENSQLRERYAALGDELRVAQANLDAEMARLKWQWAFNLDQGHGAVTQYHEAFGNLLREQARFQDLEAELERSDLLLNAHAISREEHDHIRYSKDGQERLVAKLKQSLPELQKRAEQADLLLKKNAELAAGARASGNDLLKPFFAKVETIEAERIRLLERMKEGQLRAPAAGTVLKLERLPGERCKMGDPVLTFLRDGSIEVVLYLPQELSTHLQPGQDVPLVLDPYPEAFRCRVQRIGDRFEEAPEHLKRHYHEGQKLLPVFLQPDAEMSRWMALRTGGVVKLSRLNSTPWSWWKRWAS